MQCETMTLTREGTVARLTLTRPEKLNAVSRGLLKDLVAVTGDLAEDDQTRVVILSGEGRAFSAGADVTEVPTEATRRASDNFRTYSRLGLRAMRGLIDLEQITIAAISGWAIGGGVSLAMACDIRIAAEGTCFYLPEMDFGLHYMWTSTVLLSRLVGPARAKDLILTGRRFDAEQALQWGLVDRVVPGPRLMEEAGEMAAHIANKPYTAVRATKLIVNSISAPYGEIGAYDPELASLAVALGDSGSARELFMSRRLANEGALAAMPQLSQEDGG